MKHKTQKLVGALPANLGLQRIPPFSQGSGPTATRISSQATVTTTEGSRLATTSGQDCRCTQLGPSQPLVGAPTWKRRCALTLIEVVVVVSLICIVSAILFPVIARAKELGVRTESLSNLHQLGLSAIEYATDSDDTLPPYRNLEPWLLENDPQVTTTGIPTDSPEPRELVASLKPYDGNADGLWHTNADPYRDSGACFGGINHDVSSYVFMPLSSNNRVINVFPPVLSLNDLRQPGILFNEPSGIVGHSFLSYWQAPISQYVLIDGSAKGFHLTEGKKILK